MGKHNNTSYISLLLNYYITDLRASTERRLGFKQGDPGVVKVDGRKWIGLAKLVVVILSDELLLSDLVSSKMVGEPSSLTERLILVGVDTVTSSSSESLLF